MSDRRRIPLELHARLQLEKEPSVSAPGLPALLARLAEAVADIDSEIRRSGALESWRGTSETNVYGERIKRLDRRAHELLVDSLGHSGLVTVMASEEESQLIEPARSAVSGFAVAFDPLDGSDNLEASLPVGTIFSIYPHQREGRSGLEGVLRPGREQVAAGYVLYGAATVLVYTLGRTVDCFELDPVARQFVLTRPHLRMPEEVQILSINEANEPYWPDWVPPFLRELKARNTATERRVVSRFVGTLVADFHRCLVHGGVMLVPEDRRTGTGKLRLLFECNPVALVAHVAGGAASDGVGSILERPPEGVHARCGWVVGPVREVQHAQLIRRGMEEEVLLGVPGGLGPE